MPCYAITGRTGQGKGLCAVGLLMDYLKRGKPVATNVDLYLENYPNPYKRDLYVVRVPDMPSYEILTAIGDGNPNPKDEDENGLLYYMEATNFLDSRKWNAPGREGLNQWFRERRKYGWDVAFDLQDLNTMDSRVKDSVIDYEVRAIFIRALRIPVITTIIKMITGKRRVLLPKFCRFHVAKMRNIELDLNEDTETYRGRDYYPLYNTAQRTNPEYPHGTYCYLTPWHLKGRYLKPRPTLKQIVELPVKLSMYAILQFSALFSHDVRQYLEKDRVSV